MPYVTPLQDFRFALNELAGLGEVLKLPGFEEVTPDLVDAILEENGRFVEQAVAPLNVPGDTQPPVWKDGQVTTTPGYAQGFRDYAAGGWQGLQHPVAWGGQGLPKLVAAAPGENIQAASLAFSLCPMLTDGVIEALLTVGSEAQRKQYVPQLIGGKWTGTMNLTEPQAGSDLAQVATRAVKQADGSYRLSGQKIFITYGDHDLAENIIHLVLARTPDAPAGVKGISLFIVPKFLVQADGSLGKRNDVWCASLEHKLGIHGSPTAVLLYGSGKGEVGEGAIGYLVGEQNRGLEYMFIMMNAARYSVGQQGIGVSERACQHALAYARERVQGRAVEGSAAAVAIVRHPDVQRMLMTMKALTEAARAVSYVTAAAHDKGTHHPDPEQRSRNRAFYEYMVPIVKGFSTETAVEVASLGLQVHGGMGYIEETGAAQYYRDARILPIYEGTTAIQANDLVSRKTQRDGGATAHAAIAAMRETLRAVETEAKRASAGEQEGLRLLRDNLDSAIQAYEAGVAFILEQSPTNIRAVYSSSVPYLMLAGVVHGGWQMARAVLACRRHLAAGSTDPFHTAKLATGLFYGAHILPRALALSAAVRAGVVADACGASLNIA
ncbi:acyl-CoA dehydrogenase, middle domain protein 5 [Achromobacter xylosoxidans A8]|uniref:3-methylmercaptopropionyl-CoA dehydrogenase n=1 Tax=Achromobacter xylosoxidans (strain A8) TaxID=762376 RepID=E3HVS3_ACHXA|nr:acyl-CoA dehydrogenase [Achromobacter xylosoxidans]ADP15076.1 acyl-CoA dehydrogenase, middle domain protein 5 [Achromobacter xylosoxidans A8]